MATDSQESKNDDEILVKTASDYSNILNFKANPAVKENAIDLVATFEAVLTRLDEFYGMLDMIRNDAGVLNEEVLNSYKAERDKMRLIFRQIDDLEKFIQVVKSDYETMEKCVKEAENEHGSIGTIKKAISGLKFSNLWKKNERTPQPPAHPQKEFVPPSIFSTSDYIAKKFEEETEE